MSAKEVRKKLMWLVYSNFIPLESLNFFVIFLLFKKVFTIFAITYR